MQRESRVISSVDDGIVDGNFFSAFQILYLFITRETFFLRFFSSFFIMDKEMLKRIEFE